MSQPHEPTPPQGYIHTRVVGMTDAEGNDVTDPDLATDIEAVQVTDDGVVEHVYFTPSSDED